MKKSAKHDDKWLNYDDDGRDQPGVPLRITRRYIELMGGIENAIESFYKYGKDAQ
jgi:hypothetical protein